jgi:hypothetical protein
VTMDDLDEHLGDTEDVAEVLEELARLRRGT